MATPISIRLQENINHRLDELAIATGRSKAQIIRDCISDRIQDLEDIYISLKRLEKGEKMWSLKEIEKKYRDHDEK